MIAVLVVDDDQAICALVAEVLGDAGCTVMRAYDGDAALAIARHHLPQVIVSDIKMPRMSGIDLVRALRADTATQHIPVILSSAERVPDVHIMRDIVAFLPKPYDIDLLEKVVLHTAQAKPGSPSPGPNEA